MQRASTRPKEPRDLDFELNRDHIPGAFLQVDLRVDGARHFVFFTVFMANLLATAKTWYVDATFKVVSPPFYQLF